MQHRERAGAFLVRRGESEFDRRLRNAERVAERLVLQELQAHVRLRRDPMIGKEVVELLGVRLGEAKTNCGARNSRGETAFEMTLKVDREIEMPLANSPQKPK